MSEQSVTMCVHSQSVNCGDDQVVYHRWQGRAIGIRLAKKSESPTLEIHTLNGDQPQSCSLTEHQIARLRSAVDVALDLDTTLSRALLQGSAARIELRPPRHRPSPRLRKADEASELRPRVEELVAPLLFHTNTSKRSLRPFQEFGVQWLTERRTGVLADDMGLGKTAQALRAIERLVVNGTIRSALIVCPKSLLANWEAESETWVPGLTVVRSVPSRQDSDEAWSAILGRSHIIVTNYEQLRPLPTPFETVQVDLVVADEAHRLRRSQAKLVKAFRLMNFERFWALTGTPIERHPIDLATLLSLLEPTRFSENSFTVGSELRAQARPYLLRRMKKDVLDELPDVIDTKETIELTPQQQRAYNAALSQPLPKELGEVLQRLTMLRSICDSEPVSGVSAKLNRVMEILQKVQDAGEKAVVFSYLLRPLELLAQRMSLEKPPLNSVSLTGKLTMDERAHVLRKFKTDDRVMVLLCSSRVGGEGLTLTEANHVIFINEWWNPSSNDQARDRVVRFGQERIVHVHRFKCKDTVEEVLDHILEKKNEAYSSVVDALAMQVQMTETDSRELLNKALESLVSIV